MHEILRRFDTFQRRKPVIAFPVAVVMKYSDDKAGSWAALLTYYTFLSLFPLLLLLTTLADTILAGHPNLEQSIIRGVTNYFPLLGGQLSSHVHGLHRSGLALAAGILFTLYGARGVADAFRKGVQHVWHVPPAQRDSFPKSFIKSLCLIFVGGIGFIAASILAGLAAATGHTVGFRIFSVALNIFVLFWVFNFLLDFSLPRHLPIKQTRLGAAIAAIGLVSLQLLGGYILTNELKSLDALYSYFAIALGLLFWIYLQAQMLYYAMEIATVSSGRLWPRSLAMPAPTMLDKQLAHSNKKNIAS